MQRSTIAYAQTVADQHRTQHHVEVDPDDVSLVDRLAMVYDEPYADSSAIPTYRVCELARKTVTVALSGDGDENFGGYRLSLAHQQERLRSLLPLQLRRPVFGLPANSIPRPWGAAGVPRRRLSRRCAQLSGSLFHGFPFCTTVCAATV